ncbi:MAG: urea transporter [Candidatus Riflebacteria bacterium]|nr:urea transporter [Candidatus Riflebacteria bacterium]
MKALIAKAFIQMKEIPLWYSGIFFSHQLLPGILMMLAVTGSGDWGISSLICPFLMMFWGKVTGISQDEIKCGGYFANAILFGLYLGNTFSSIQFLIIAGFTGSFLLFLITRSLNHILGAKYHLPACSYPFVLTVFLFTFVCHSEEYWFRTSFLRPLSYSEGKIDAFFHNPFKLSITDKIAHEILGFIFSVGSIFYQMKFFSCLLATIALALTSRISILLSILGYTTSRILIAIFPFYSGGHELARGFNSVLTAIAVGGIFFVPGRKTTLLMVSSQFIVFFATLLCIASTRLTGGDWTTLPFNIALSLTLLALQGRSPQARPIRPAIAFETPEEAVAYFRRWEERIFLYQISFPVYGRWKIVQGFNGNETHKEAWRYGVDLAAVDESGKRFRSTGINVEDYFAFNAPLLSPVDGVISAISDQIPDNSIGNMNTESPWGNFVIIYSAGVYIGLYHLKKNSILVTPGQAVSIGTPLGKVGNSGRSAIPHLHLQLQLLPAAGSANIPFLFRDLLVEAEKEQTFYPFLKPEELQIASTAPSNDTTRLLLFPKNGEIWQIEVEKNKKKSIIRWKFSYSLYGNVIITSETGEEIEYHVGLKSVEVIRFSGEGFSLLNLFALSLSDMPFALKPDLKWKTVLFGKNAYHFLKFYKRLLSWLTGDIFSAMCFKMVIEETHFSILSCFSSQPKNYSPTGIHIIFNFGNNGFISLCVKSDEQNIITMQKIASE